jgi:hypothetical protein
VYISAPFVHINNKIACSIELVLLSWNDSSFRFKATKAMKFKEKKVVGSKKGYSHAFIAVTTAHKIAVRCIHYDHDEILLQK